MDWRRAGNLVAHMSCCHVHAFLLWLKMLLKSVDLCMYQIKLKKIKAGRAPCSVQNHNQQKLTTVDKIEHGMRASVEVGSIYSTRITNGPAGGVCL